ncbi:MAG: TonB-dependent siderophore receptor [Sporomusaceae bacterium]|nr:TonB-dependent siderophore receptor [Sporomusaceae bacterium]
MCKQKLRPSSRKLLCALMGSGLLLQLPYVAFAAGDSAEAASQTPPAVESQAESGELPIQEVEVTAVRDRGDELPPAYAGNQVATGARLGLLGNVSLMNAPFNIISYTSETIENQQAHSLRELLLNDPSVRFSMSDGHIAENFTIRGIQLLNEELAFNGQYGMAPAGHAALEFIERVEVLKGPGALLNGMAPSGAVGGSINLVPKRAGDEPLTRFTTDYTSGSQLGGHIDIGRRFGSRQQFGIRFNGVYRDGKTGVEDASRERKLGALGLDYRGDRYRLSLDAYSGRDRFENGTASVYQLLTPGLKAPDSKTNLLRGAWGEAENDAILFKGEYDLRDNLSVFAGIGRQRYRSAGFISNQAFGLDASGQVTLRPNYLKRYMDTSSAELGLRGQFQTGAVTHRIVFSANALDIESGARVNPPSAATISNIYHPVTPLLATDPASPAKTAETALSSVALADTLSFDRDRIQLTLGVRRQNIHTKNFSSINGALTGRYDQSATTPAIALVLKPWAAPVSLYANYIEGLNKGGEVTDTGASNYGEVFKPFKSKQVEAGVKWDAGSLTNTLSLFQILSPSTINRQTSDTAYIVTDDGEERMRGVEWNVFGQLTPDLRILGGAAHTRGKLTRTTDGLHQGNIPRGTPEWQTNLGFEWDLPGKPGLTLTARAVYTGSQYLNSANTMKIPSWVRYDIGARYNTRINGQPVVIRATVENLFDKNYWTGVFNRGAQAPENFSTLGGGRTFKLSASFEL